MAIRLETLENPRANRLKTACKVVSEPGLCICLLYTSDAADERSSVDLGGRRIIKKKKNTKQRQTETTQTDNKTTSTNQIVTT